MPTLRFHGVETEKFCKISQELHEELMTIYEVPADYINLEIIKSDYIIDSKVTPGFPIVEVCAFKRDDEIQDLVAKVVAHYLTLAGYDESELYYSFAEPRYYYGNGVHF